MRITLDCRWCKKSGIGAFIDGILPHLIKTENNFTLLVPEGLQEYIKTIAAPKKISFIPCSVEPFSIRELLFFPRKIAKIINKDDFYFSPYCNVPSGIKIPIFTTIHDVVFLDVKGLSGKIGTFIRKSFYLYAIFRSRAIFTVSQFSKSRIIEKLRCKKEIYVVHSSVPEFLLKKDKAKIEKTGTIIFIGNIKRHKGLQVLIPAFYEFCARLEKSGEKAPVLVIVGTKENFRTKDKEISALIEESSSKNVEFTGFISDEELKSRLSRAKILVQPSFYEGFGLPPLQALSCGTRAIVSDIEVFREVYEGYPVTFFKCGDAADLAQKLLDVWKEDLPLPPFEDRYSFRKTADQILSVLGGFKDTNK